jgi:hypothetical protein
VVAYSRQFFKAASHLPYLAPYMLYLEVMPFLGQIAVHRYFVIVYKIGWVFAK